MLTSFYLANTYLRKAFMDGVPITHMQLQQLLFDTCQAYEVIFEESLLSEQFTIIWDRTGRWNQKFLLSLYNKINCYGDAAIDSFIRDASGEVYIVKKKRFAFRHSKNAVLGRIITKIWNDFKSSVT